MKVEKFTGPNKVLRSWAARPMLIVRTAVYKLNELNLRT